MKSNKSNGQLTAQINVNDHRKSGFDLSNNVLGTGKIGRIIPTRALHVQPNDTIKQDSKVAVQFEPLAVPILANMDVKQEHFYVPYNVVWKNWDKFISGGEKMDYVGVVPNISPRRVVEVIGSLFQNCFNINLTFFNTKEGEVFISMSNSGDFAYDAGYLDNVNEAVSIYGALDLVEPQRQVVREIRDWSYGLHTSFGALFVNVLGSSTPAVRENSLYGYMEQQGLLGDKYLNEIKNAVLTKIMASGPACLPTSNGMRMLHYMYDFYKQFIGLGSNLDYLNMFRVTFSEFLLAVTDYLSTAIQNWDGENNSDSSRVTLSLYALSSYFSEEPTSVLHLRANYSVWYNNYRDSLLENLPAEPYDGDEITDSELITLLFPRQRCWEKDAFTTALDNPGTGNVAVPLGVTNDMTGEDYSVYTLERSENNDASGVYKVSFEGEEWRVPTSYLTGNNPKVDESEYSTTGFTLFQLDAAQRAQKWLQKALYFGNRIADFYYLRFGVRFLDSRLRLPELLASSSELVKVDVLVNNTTTAESVAGDRAGFASAYDNGNSFDRYCEEHGVILSYMTIMPQVTYAYGRNRDYSRLDQFDFAFEDFATLGMDAVYDTELSSTTLGAIAGNYGAKVFGYQGKYYDYKAKHSEEHGELLDTQDMYTFGRKFNMLTDSGRPRLNYEFVHCFPSLDMFVVDSPLVDYFRFDVRHSTASERNLPSQSLYI